MKRIAGQSRRWSLIEAVASTFIGFWISFFAMQGVYVLMGIPVSSGQNIVIAIILTAISIARGYVLRRFFNWVYIKLTRVDEQT